MCLTLAATAHVGFAGGDMEMHQGEDQSSVLHRAMQKDAIFARSGQDITSS